MTLMAICDECDVRAQSSAGRPGLPSGWSGRVFDTPAGYVAAHACPKPECRAALETRTAAPDAALPH